MTGDAPPVPRPDLLPAGAAAPGVAPRPLEVDGDLAAQARTLALGGLPREETAAPWLNRSYRIGTADVAVTYRAVSEAPLPYGRDRALLAWLVERAASDGGGVRFRSLGGLSRDYRSAGGDADFDAFARGLVRIRYLMVTVVVADPESGRVWELRAPPVTCTTGVDWGELYRVAAPVTDGPSEVETTGRGRRGGTIELHPKFTACAPDLVGDVPPALADLYRDRPLLRELARYVLFRAAAARGPTAIPLGEVAGHVGFEGEDPAHLAGPLRRALIDVVGACPGLRATVDDGGAALVVEPWRRPGRT